MLLKSYNSVLSRPLTSSASILKAMKSLSTVSSNRIDPNPIIISSSSSNQSNVHNHSESTNYTIPITNLNNIPNQVSSDSFDSKHENSEYPKLNKEKHELLASMLRVDHAGEYAAVCIYQGQLDILRNSSYNNTLKTMKNHEIDHLVTLNKLLPQYHIRPTIMTPVWHLAGYVMGATSALLGPQAAMACTVAVETVVAEHYNDQLRTVINDPDLKKLKVVQDMIIKHRDDEMLHHKIGLENHAESAPFYSLLTGSVKVACSTALWISKRI